jgi:hypothetical protein
MKSFKRILLFIIILLLCVSGSGAQPAQAQSSIKLKPGTYAGVFNLDVGVDSNQHVAKGPVAATWQWTDDFYLKSTVDVTVTAPDQGRASPNVDLPLLYEIRDLSVSGAANCNISAVMDADATVVFLAPLVSNYDPQKSSFTSSLTVSDLTNQHYKDIRGGSSPACSQQMSQTTMTESLKVFTGLINDIGFHVLYARDGRMGGDVTMADWEKTIPFPEGGQAVRTLSGVWQAYLVPTKSKGWKK